MGKGFSATGREILWLLGLVLWLRLALSRNPKKKYSEISKLKVVPTKKTTPDQSLF